MVKGIVVAIVIVVVITGIAIALKNKLFRDKLKESNNKV